MNQGILYRYAPESDIEETQLVIPSQEEEVERKNRDLKFRLAIVVCSSDHIGKLPNIRFVLISSMSDNTGCTTAYLHLRRELRTNDDVVYDLKARRVRPVLLRVFESSRRMTKLRWLFFLAAAVAICRSQDEKSTEDCICTPVYNCINGEISVDGARVINPRSRLFDEEPLDNNNEPRMCGDFQCVVVIQRQPRHNSPGEAEFGEWPWQAAILKKDNGLVFKCGGTLIDDRHIITVAHCVDKFYNNLTGMIVRLGEWDTQVAENILPHEDFGVEEIMIHPGYRFTNLHNDIAVVRLNRTVIFKPHIDTACLPQDDDDFIGQECVATGWGSDAYEEGQFSLIMREVYLLVIRNTECQDMLRRTRLGPRFRLYENFLCAGGQEKVDSCKGDGGGPLACYREDNSYAVAGLVSWGIDCGTEKVPGVYVDVKKYTDWIVSKTGRPIEEYWNIPTNS
ncbi:phenoloxidase-activating factor 1 [Caerostris extrusa]|uniref:Phenoloxidase-activating factor 1 n=1 Tax=Caerostris extrusa TaxID=172846 RepID=A0AAV4WG63_CAEEX|nr:phenoloxidase-activating factor 1 [Caerostris extrusa]